MLDAIRTTLMRAMGSQKESAELRLSVVLEARAVTNILRKKLGLTPAETEVLAYLCAGRGDYIAYPIRNVPELAHLRQTLVDRIATKLIEQKLVTLVSIDGNEYVSAGPGTKTKIAAALNS